MASLKQGRLWNMSSKSPTVPAAVPHIGSRAPCTECPALESGRAHCCLLCRRFRIAADTRLGLKDKLISAVRKDTPPGLEDYPKGERGSILLSMGRFHD